MKNITVLLLVTLMTSYTLIADELRLRENSFGPLLLQKDTKISLPTLQKYFPQYIFSHGIGQGDSPDFHYFDAKDNKSEVVFSIISYIDKESDASSEQVVMDLLVIYSKEIKDEYGLANGMRYSDIVKARGNKLTFGANHHDNHIGLKNIWYALSSDGFSDNNGPDINPEDLSIMDIEKHDPVIVAISWPVPRW